jgi:hypothetical protein
VFGQHTNQIQAVGFKFHYNHFWFHTDLLPVLQADEELRVIHLQRRNMLRSLVSTKIAEQTGMWLQHDAVTRKRKTLLRKMTRTNLGAFIAHPVRSLSRLQGFLRPVNLAPAAPRGGITLTYEDCERHFYRVRHEIGHFGGLFASHPIIEVAYEEIVASRDDTFARLEQFLGVKPGPVSTTLRRQNPEPLQQLISNYSELREAFAGTPEESFFDH